MVTLNPSELAIKINLNNFSTKWAHGSLIMQYSFKTTSQVPLVVNNTTLLTSPKAKSHMRLKTLSI